MKRTGAALIVFALLVTTFQFSANAAVKAGANCTKAGVKKVDAAGKTLTCLKVGKKLTWNKTAVIPVAKQSPAPTPVTSVAPTPVTSVAPVAVIPDMPTSFDDLVKNYKGISYAAWSKSQAKILASSSISIPLEILIGSNTKLNNKNPEFAFSQINKLYAGNVLPKNIVLLAFNFQDRDWAVTKMDQIVPNAGSSWIKDVACPSADNCIGGGSFHNLSNKTALIVITTGIDPNNISNTISGTLEAHEYAHSIEQSSADALRPAVNLLKSPWPPNWYWEGLANFSQHAAIYSNSFDEYSKYRRESSGVIFRDSTWNAQYIEGYFQTNLTNEWASKYPRGRQYDLGAMFVEILVSLKGPDSAMQVFRESINGSGFETAFEKVYGISFTKALPIMSKSIALELGRN
jgi:hypothetical protein